MEKPHEIVLGGKSEENKVIFGRFANRGHCDGARAYRYVQIPGVITDSVRHKRPNPIYAATWKHRLPRDYRKAHVKGLPKNQVNTVWVKKRTQLIDNVGRQLKLIEVHESG